MKLKLIISSEAYKENAFKIIAKIEDGNYWGKSKK